MKSHYELPTTGSDWPLAPLSPQQWQPLSKTMEELGVNTDPPEFIPSLAQVPDDLQL
jgi:hypothetical protein